MKTPVKVNVKGEVQKTYNVCVCVCVGVHASVCVCVYSVLCTRANT